MNIEVFREYQVDTYHRAVDSYATMLAIKEAKNQAADELGRKVGGSIQMQGGGFGFKGAMKGVAQAEAFIAIIYNIYNILYRKHLLRQFLCYWIFA